MVKRSNEKEVIFLEKFHLRSNEIYHQKKEYSQYFKRKLRDVIMLKMLVGFLTVLYYSFLLRIGKTEMTKRIDYLIEMQTTNYPILFILSIIFVGISLFIYYKSSMMMIGDNPFKRDVYFIVSFGIFFFVSFFFSIDRRTYMQFGSLLFYSLSVIPTLIIERVEKASP